MLFAELFNFRANFFQQLPRFRELFRVRASKLRMDPEMTSAVV